ncbi:heat shock 70 kDa protein 16-like [Aristolochia californica]|uniref:heat shock 70 kDa protein 16-like n=1 Tax=Aristolochia californica TaxID=171875 RepID=UPI0035D9DB2D
MSVVGFDIGNENCVIAVVKQRGIDVLLNDESKRETPAVVSFGEKQRFLGSAGAASATMNPKSTISQVKRLIGLSYCHPDVQNELRLLPYATSQAPDGSILVHLHYLGDNRTFTPVQIMAMLFSHLKQIAEKNSDTVVSDCVIGIPVYFTDFQKRAYLHAAAIAGLKPLRLLHDCTATALGYGIYKTDFLLGSPTNVVFVDIGHCDTQVSIVSFEAGQMRTLSHAFERSLGGRDFDEVLFTHFAKQFIEEYKIDVYSSVRASTRLRAACEKVKKVLSANAEAPINIECLMDEKDVKGFIKREEFEKIATYLLERITIPCNKALADAGLGVDDIHSVELVGSGSRIPAIIRLLTALFKREPSRKLNASECVARGCALQCAMLSPIFRVREYEVQDCFPFSIGFTTDEGPICTLSNNILFPKGQPIPSVKILTFHRTNMFHLDAFYMDPSELPSGMAPKISSFMIGPFQVSTGGKSKVKVRVVLNLHGIVAVESAYLLEEEEDDSVASSDKMEAEFSSESDVACNGVENGGSSKAESAHIAAANSGEWRASGVDGMQRGRSRRLEIPVSETIFGGMSKAEVSEAQEKELQLAYQDRMMEQTKDKRNALEAFIYETRNKLFDLYRSFCTDVEKEEISKSLQETEEWLYDDGDDESEMVYTSKLEQLKKLVDPVENRFKDDNARQHVTKQLLKRIVDYRTGVKSMANCDRDAVINECNKAEQWLREKMQLQDSLPKNCDPVLWSSEIKRMMEVLDATCRLLMRPRTSPQRQGDTRGADHSDTSDNSWKE